jgi:hypothetical protein
VYPVPTHSEEDGLGAKKRAITKTPNIHANRLFVRVARKKAFIKSNQQM